MIRDLLEQANDIQTKLNLLKKAQEQMKLIVGNTNFNKVPGGAAVVQDGDLLLELAEILK